MGYKYLFPLRCCEGSVKFILGCDVIPDNSAGLSRAVWDPFLPWPTCQVRVIIFLQKKTCYLHKCRNLWHLLYTWRLNWYVGCTVFLKSWTYLKCILYACTQGGHTQGGCYKVCSEQGPRVFTKWWPHRQRLRLPHLGVHCAAMSPEWGECVMARAHFCNFYDFLV